MKPWYEARQYHSDNIRQSDYENGHYEGQVELLRQLSDGSGRLLEGGMDAVSKDCLNSMLKQLGIKEVTDERT
jgi:hypothetical protein